MEKEIVVSLVYSTDVEKDGKEITTNKITFKDAKSYGMLPGLLKIINKDEKIWFFPYTNIKSITFKEYEKQKGSKY